MYMVFTTGFGFHIIAILQRMITCHIIFFFGIMHFYYTTDMKTTAIIYITMITVSVTMSLGLTFVMSKDFDLGIGLA